MAKSHDWPLSGAAAPVADDTENATGAAVWAALSAIGGFEQYCRVIDFDILNRGHGISAVTGSRSEIGISSRAELGKRAARLFRSRARTWGYRHVRSFTVGGGSARGFVTFCSRYQGALIAAPEPSPGQCGKATTVHGMAR